MSDINASTANTGAAAISTTLRIKRRQIKRYDTRRGERGFRSVHSATTVKLSRFCVFIMLLILETGRYTTIQFVEAWYTVSVGAHFRFNSVGICSDGLPALLFALY